MEDQLSEKDKEIRALQQRLKKLETYVKFGSRHQQN